MQQEGHVVPGDVEVARVDLGGPGHLVELLRRHLRPVGIVPDDSVGVLVTDAEDLVQRLAVGVLDDGEVELAAANEVDGGALVQCLVGRSGDRRPDEGNLDPGVGLLDDLGHLLVALPAHGAGEEDEELVVLEDADDVRPTQVVGRSVDQARPLQHARGIGEPDRVPVGLDLACGGPAAACAAIELLKGGRVEEEGLQRLRHCSNFTIFGR